MPFQTIRFYLADSAAAVSPALNPAGVGGSWSNTGQAIQRAMSQTRGSTSTNTHAITITATNSSTWLSVQFVSESLSLTAPSILGSGLYRCSTNEHSITSPVRTAALIARAHFVSSDGATVRGPSGNQPDSGEMPPIYYSGPYVDSLTLQTEGKSAPVTPFIVSGVPQWSSASSTYADYASYPTVVPGDRLVLSLGFSAFSGTNRMPVLEYGDSPSTPLTLASPDASGHPFFDLYVFVAEGQAEESAVYSRPAHPRHRPERFRQPATPSDLLGEEFLG